MAMAMVMAMSLLVVAVKADGECSKGSPCPDPNNCCSQFGFCGRGDAYCGSGCQAGPCSGGGGTPPPSPGGSGLGAILTRSLYEQFFPGHLAFYSYDALIEASKLFPQFGTTGDTNTRKREIAAYVAHVTHETSGVIQSLLTSVDLNKVLSVLMQCLYVSRQPFRFLTRVGKADESVLLLLRIELGSWCTMSSD